MEIGIIFNDFKELLSHGEIGLIPNIGDVLLTWLIVGLILVPLEYFIPAHEGQKKSHKSLRLDLVYCIFTPIVTRIISNIFVVIIFVVLFRVLGFSMERDFLSGFGPLSRQPLFLQAIEILFLADFIDYWTHRTFHTSRFWKIHAVHHSAEEMDWISSSRMHPLNESITRLGQLVPLVLLGFAPKVIILIVPYIVFYVIFLHSNIRWDFGPLRYVLVSPAYHRWHHSSDKEALDKNFAGVFPVWDLIFGTFYMPKNLPKRYGVTHEPPPENLLGQLLYPFQSKLRRDLD